MPGQLQSFVLASLAQLLVADSLKAASISANPVSAEVSKVMLSFMVHLNFRYLPKLAQGGKGLLCPSLGGGYECIWESDRGCMDTASSFTCFPNPALLEFWVPISFFLLFCSSSLHSVCFQAFLCSWGTEYYCLGTQELRFTVAYSNPGPPDKNSVNTTLIYKHMMGSNSI